MERMHILGDTVVVIGASVLCNREASCDRRGCHRRADRCHGNRKDKGTAVQRDEELLERRGDPRPSGDCTRVAS